MQSAHLQVINPQNSDIIDAMKNGQRTGSVGLGGVKLIVLAIGPKVAGSKPAESDRFLTL
jgi:hypothetical protein